MSVSFTVQLWRCAPAELLSEWQPPGAWTVNPMTGMQEQKVAVGKSSQAVQEKDRELQKALKEAKVCTSHRSPIHLLTGLSNHPCFPPPLSCIHPSIHLSFYWVVRLPLLPFTCFFHHVSVRKGKGM